MLNLCMWQPYRSQSVFKMKENMLKILRHITFLFSFVLCYGFINPPDKKQDFSAANSITVIVNLSNPTNDLTKKQLKGIFKGEVLRWPDKKKIILAVMKSSTPIGKITAEKILNMSANDMDQYYLMQVFQGKITAPKTFESTEDLKNFVANTQGAIGIIDQSNLSNNLKAIKIDGSEAISSVK